MDLEGLLEQTKIGENQDYEFKSAEGGLPRDMWETVSSFANTNGGYIVLGISEKKKAFLITGVKNPEGKQKIFWDIHNNSEKLSTPICSNADVFIRKIDNKNILVIRVPQAERKQRPVYINNNPINGTFKRNHEGDYRCTKDEIEQMFRDASDEPQDFQILEGFDLNDLDKNTLKAFRQRFSSRDPDHPWLEKSDRDLLEHLGGWRRDRKTNLKGLTYAGLLMFGLERSILDAFPHYHLDYQEKLSNDPEERWTHRLTIDGKWQPNLFNFYYLTYGRLVNGLDVPFKLEKTIRQEETHVHEALREALANSIIHANHLSRKSITIIKEKNLYIFSNPGRLRIPIDKLYEGGFTDARNPNIQRMFQMLGLGDKAGSGFSKILRAWKEQSWYLPLVSEKIDLEVTSVYLPTLSLIPENIESDLKEIVGDNYYELSELERIILTITHKFKKINNSYIQRYRSEHPQDIGKCCRSLVQKGYLVKLGHGRGTSYILANSLNSEYSQVSSEHSQVSSEHSQVSSEHSQVSSEHLQVNSEYLLKLNQIAEPIRQTKYAKQESVRQIILELCDNRYLSINQLSELLGRNKDTVRIRYINPMLQQGLLETKFDESNHPNQAYTKINN